MPVPLGMVWQQRFRGAGHCGLPHQLARSPNPLPPRLRVFHSCAAVEEHSAAGFAAAVSNSARYLQAGGSRCLVRLPGHGPAHCRVENSGRRGHGTARRHHCRAGMASSGAGGYHSYMLVRALLGPSVMRQIGISSVYSLDRLRLWMTIGTIGTWIFWCACPIAAAVQSHADAQGGTSPSSLTIQRSWFMAWSLGLMFTSSMQTIGGLYFMRILRKLCREWPAARPLPHLVLFLRVVTDPLLAAG